MNDNVVSLFRHQVEKAGATIEPIDPVGLPDDDDIVHLESLVQELGLADNDEEKVAAMKQITHWLTLWKF